MPTNLSIAIPPDDSSRVHPVADAPPTVRDRLRRAFVGVRSNPFWFNALVALAGSLVITALLGYLNGWFGDGWARLRSVAGNAAFSLTIGLSLWLTCAYLNAWLSDVVDWLGRPWRALAITIGANVVAVVLARGLVDVVFFAGVFGLPLARAIDNVSPANYLLSIGITLLITAVYQGAYFLELWKARLLETEQLKTANLAAKYEALNAQINPHFLFNSLNVLSALVRRDPDSAEAFIQGLSGVYRYVLDVRRESLVPLARELDALDAYVRLVRMRFGADRLRVDVELDGGANAGTARGVVPLVLQMLVENAVKHNGATRQTPLHVRLSAEGDYLAVSNNRVRRYDRPEGRGIGLDNVRERYRIATGREVIVEDLPECFTVKLPVIDLPGVDATAVSTAAHQPAAHQTAAP